MKKFLLIVCSLGLLAHSSFAQTHFQTVYTGNPYLAMNIYVTSAVIGDVSLVDGDEIGIFDGEYCVGAAVVSGGLDPYLAMVAATDDPGTPEVDGFAAGNTIQFRLWRASDGVENTTVAPTDRKSVA